MTAKEYIQRSNANGKWVSETMFLDTIHRLETQIQCLTKELHKIGLNQAHEAGSEQREDTFRQTAGRYWYMLVGTMLATLGSLILNLLSA